jgi:hypothetical protein
MKRSSVQHLAAKFFLSIGYLSGVFGWLWVLLVAVPPLVKSGAIDALLANPAPTQPVIAAPAIETSPIALLVIGVVTLVILIITVIILIRIPRTIVDSGERFVTHAAEAVVPVIAHHKPLPPKQRRVLSRRIMLVLQLCLSVIPLFVSVFLPPYDELSSDIIMTVAALLAGVSTAAFILAWSIEPRTKTTSRTRSRASRE